MSRRALIQTLEAVDDDGLVWEWECGGYTYRAEHQGLRDSWVVQQILLEGQGASILDEQECVSLAEALLFAIDVTNQHARAQTGSGLARPADR